MSALKGKTMKSSHSSMSCFRRCSYEYYLSRVLGYEPVKKSRPLAFGSALHAALNEYHTGEPMGAVLAAWLDACIKYKLDMADEILGEVLLLGYAARWGTLEEDASVEHHFEYSPTGPDGKPDQENTTHGYIDVLYSKVMDHKTTASKLTPSKLASMARSPQALEYILAAPEGVREAVWDVIHSARQTRREATPIAEREFYKRGSKDGKKKPGDPKPGTYLRDESWEEFRQRLVDDIAENPSKYFARVDIRPTEEELDARRYDVWATTKLMQLAVESNAFPRNERSCELYGGCGYAPVCWEGVDPRSSELYQIRKVDR